MIKRFSDIRKMNQYAWSLDKYEHIVFHTKSSEGECEYPLQKCSFLERKYKKRYHSSKWENLANFYQPNYLFAQKAKFEYDRIFQSENYIEFKFSEQANEDQKKQCQKLFKQSFDTEKFKKELIENYVVNPLGIIALIFDYEILKNETIVNPKPKIHFIKPTEIDFVVFDVWGANIQEIGFTVSKNKKIYLNTQYQEVYVNDELKGSRLLHNLGFCPAIKIIPNITDHPINNALDLLDNFCDLEMCLNFFNLNGAIPKFWHLKLACNYYDRALNVMCRDGWLIGLGANGNSIHKECPTCAENKTMFGSIGGAFEIEPPDTTKNEQFINPPANYIEPQGNTIQHLVDSINKKEQQINSLLTGHSTSLLNNEAVNESQVKSSFEERIAVLNVVRKHLTSLYNFIANSIAKFISEGVIQEIEIEFSYEYFQESAETKLGKIEKAIKAGMPKSIINHLVNEYFEFVGETSDSEKDELISKIYPFINYELPAVQFLFTANVLTAFHLFVYIFYQTLIKKYESQNEVDILELEHSLGFAAFASQINTYFELEYKNQNSL